MQVSTEGIGLPVEKETMEVMQLHLETLFRAADVQGRPLEGGCQ